MGLRGKTAIAIMSAYPPEVHEEHGRFHSYEHLLERVGVPGFLRGRRYNALSDDSPFAFAIYELAEKTAAVEGAYIERLNNPTPWTAKMMPLSDHAFRTLCEVVGSVGWGTGPWGLAVRFEPSDGRRDGLRAWVRDVLLPDLAPRETRIAAHFLMRDETLERPVTQEEIIRAGGKGSAQSPCLLVVEGWDLEAMQALARTLPARLEAAGAASGPVTDLYVLSHLLSAEELAEGTPPAAARMG